MTTPRSAFALVGALWRRGRRFVPAALGLWAFNIASHILVPGVNITALSRYLRENDIRSPLVDLYRLIGGGGLSGASVVALGFMPYLSARLWWWLAQRVSPRLAAWAAEPAHATASRRWIRGLTIGGAVVQSAGLASYLLKIPGVVTYPAASFTLGFMATLTGGAVLAMLLSESVERTLLGDHDSPPAPSHTDRALAEPRALPLSRPHATPVSDAATDRAPAYSPDRR